MGRRTVLRAFALTASAALIATPLLSAVTAWSSSSVPASSTAREHDHQTLVVETAVDSSIDRPAYTASTLDELAARAMTMPARTAATFVNDPSSPIQWPFSTGVPISDAYGPRAAPCGGCSTFHKGVDFVPGEGSTVVAIADGVVRETHESNSGLGVHAIIDHVVDGARVSSVSAHLRFGSLRVSPGDAVRVGQPIGSVGSTGQSTGPHLHFEILLDGVSPTDPFAWLLARVGR